MITIGIRAKPNVVTFAIFNTEENSVVNIERVMLPKALSVPESLKYLRNTILDILREYAVEKAGIRITESNSQHLNINRIQMEGVIQEAFSSSSLNSYYCGEISSISAKIGIHRTDFKKFVDGLQNYNRVENWETLDKEEREALLAAIGAENA